MIINSISLPCRVNTGSEGCLTAEEGVRLEGGVVGARVIGAQPLPGLQHLHDARDRVKRDTGQRGIPETGAVGTRQIVRDMGENRSTE